MSEMRLTALYRYPVKSLAGEELEQSLVDGFGLAEDRRWMLVDREGRYITQRELPEMALISASVDQRRLTLNAPGMTSLVVEAPAGSVEPISVKIWGDRCLARFCSNESQLWLSRYLGHTLRLVHMDEGELRQVDRQYAQEGERTAFSDGFPLLLISQASLDDLNGRMAQALPMIRFRPNLVVAGCEPFAEDGWSLIRIGEMTLRVVKPCSRCKITTVDPYTAEIGVEPLKTLASYRRQGNQVFFGQNLIHDAPGELAVGMPVEVLRHAE
jgi:uncharacterized protein YcbX